MNRSQPHNMIKYSAFLGELMKSGVYRIYFKKSGNSYYGSSINIFRRWNEHRSLLRRNLHANEKLQFLWNSNSEDSVIFEILIECSNSDFEQHEKKFIGQDKNSINIWIEPFSPKGSGRTIFDKMKGKPRPNCRHLHTDETKQKLSKIVKNHWENNPHPCKGKKRTEEEKKLISIRTREAMRAKKEGR